MKSSKQNYISYLACPYYHKDKKILLSRYKRVTEVAARLLKRGIMVYSPITHNHPISFNNMKWKHQDWMDYDFMFLNNCKKLFVLKLKGWQQSKGVGMEIERAKEMGIPIEYINY